MHTLEALVGDAGEPKGKLPSKLCFIFLHDRTRTDSILCRSINRAVAAVALQPNRLKGHARQVSLL
jgi:hypothetical protein